MARSPAEESEDPRLSLALSLASEAGRLAVAGRHALFPFDVTGYRGAPVPFLAGNPLAHATAAASCRALVPGVDHGPAGLR